MLTSSTPFAYSHVLFGVSRAKTRHFRASHLRFRIGFDSGSFTKKMQVRARGADLFLVAINIRGLTSRRVAAATGTSGVTNDGCGLFSAPALDLSDADRGSVGGQAYRKCGVASMVLSAIAA